jgi:hypothetical protein
MRACGSLTAYADVAVRHLVRGTVVWPSATMAAACPSRARGVNPNHEADWMAT